jgi:hypothetical protein
METRLFVGSGEKKHPHRGLADLDRFRPARAFGGFADRRIVRDQLRSVGVELRELRRLENVQQVGLAGQSFRREVRRAHEHAPAVHVDQELVVHDVGLGTRLAFEAVRVEQLDRRAIGTIVAAVLVDEGELPLEVLERGDDPAIVGQMVDRALDLLGARQDLRERLLEPVRQPIHDLRDIRLRIGKLARERLRADHGAVEPGRDAVFFQLRKGEGYRRFRIVLQHEIIRTRAAHRRNRVFERLAAIGLADRAIPPVKLLKRRHIAGQWLRIRLRRVEPDLVSQKALLLAGSESGATQDRESQEVGKMLAGGPIHRQQHERG